MNQTSQLVVEWIHLGRFFDHLYLRSPTKRTRKFAAEIEEIDVKFLFLVT